MNKQSAVETYLAGYVDQSPVPRLRPGELGAAYLRLRNLGTATWRGQGAHPVLLATDRPPDRASPFNVPELWPAPNRPARLRERAVAPGETGTFEIALRAPVAPGRYVEAVRLVAENLIWFNDLDFCLVVDVIVLVTGQPPELAFDVCTPIPPLLLRGGDVTELPLHLRNVGSVRWTDRGGDYGPLVQLATTEPFDHESPFHVPDRWLSPIRPARVPGFVLPGQAVDLLVPIRAPEAPGIHADRFRLVAELRGWLAGPTVTVRVTVT